MYFNILETFFQWEKEYKGNFRLKVYHLENIDKPIWIGNTVYRNIFLQMINYALENNNKIEINKNVQEIDYSYTDGYIVKGQLVLNDIYSDLELDAREKIDTYLSTKLKTNNIESFDNDKYAIYESYSIYSQDNVIVEELIERLDNKNINYIDSYDLTKDISYIQKRYSYYGWEYIN